MKILVIDVNYDHANASHRNLRNSLADVMDVRYFGPGYSSRDELDKGLLEFINGERIDLILAGSVLLLESVIDKGIGIIAPYAIHRYLMPKYLMNEALIYAKAIEEQLLQIKNIPIVLQLYSDIGTLSVGMAKKMEKLLRYGFYLMAIGEDFATINLRGRMFGEFPGNNNCYKLVKSYHKRIISMPFLGVNECNYCFSDLESRKFEWVVPGNVNSDYPQRGKVISLLKKEGVSLWSHKGINDQLVFKNSIKTRLLHIEYNSKLEKYLSLFYPNLHLIPNRVPLEKVALYREIYLEGLRNSKCAYVDGSNLKLIVGKYFEVPAAGNLMIGDVVTGLDKLGFVPGIHMIEAPPQKVYKIYQQLQKDREKMQEISRNGQKLVIEKHTFRCRATGLKRAFEAIINGNFDGSHWENGDFIVESKGV